jgi:hypothetical protein
MPQRVLRFGVRDDAGHRAATWKLWTETSGRRSEIYLACRELGTLKTSFHESGAWHVAYSKAFFEGDVMDTGPRQDRFLEKWPRPTEIAPGLTLAFRIVTSPYAVTTDIEAASPKDIIWLPKASGSQSTSIAILISKLSTSTDGWPGQRSMGTSLIGSIPLMNGETVWAVYVFEPMVDLGNKAARMHFYKGKSRKDLDSDGLRALVFGDCPDGSRVILDLTVNRFEKPETG